MTSVECSARPGAVRVDVDLASYFRIDYEGLDLDHQEKSKIIGVDEI